MFGAKSLGVIMKLLILIFGIIAIANANVVSLKELIEEEWKAFKLEYDKSYESETEEYLRMNIFLENKVKIAKHNQQFEKGLVTYNLGLNKYADMSHDEFFKTMHGYNKTIPELSNAIGVAKEDWTYFIGPANVQLPPNVDWRQKGVVTPVKDQGLCGSCWAFSATGSLEGQHSRRRGVLVSLSEQNLLDCSTRYGNNGCKGGWMANAFRYIKANGGIDTEKSYPYEAITNVCRFKPQNIGARVTGFVELAHGDENKLKEAVATIGPISVAIDASHSSFQFYKNGVYFDNSCSSSKLNHGVLVIGYGTQTVGQDYWVVKNSWGVTWGDQGYIKMARNKNNNCGIATAPIYPLV